MKTKLINHLFCSSKKTSVLLLRIFVFSFATASFATPHSTNDAKNKNELNYEQQAKITGTVIDATGTPLPGITVQEKGTTTATLTDFDGNYSITPSKSDAIIVFSSIGFTTQEIAITNQVTLNITLEEDISQLDEVVVVGYGTQKKVNLTAAVSVVGKEVFENRPTANAYRSLQGSVPGLVISNSASGGEPGAPSSINIRGFITSASDNSGGLSTAGPLVLVDGIEMDLNDIDPEDIESVSVLKDAAAAAIYGAQAAAGAVLVTTKSGKNMKGKFKVSYSNNFSFTQPTKWPKYASAIDFAYTVNDARINNNQTPYHDETDLANIIANMENPGSAPSISANAANTNWSYAAIGIDATGATDWQDIIFKDWANRSKHNISILGGDEKLNYYISAGAYDEGGLLAIGDESFQRYNLSAKISAKPRDWLSFELMTKLRKSESDFPTEVSGNSVAWNKSRILDLVSKIKPTLPQFDPIYGEELLQHSYYPFWESQRATAENNQLVLIPKIVIEPIKDLKVTAQLNYKRDNNLSAITILTSQLIRPAGLIDKVSQAGTSYSPTFFTQEYYSPNVFASYDKSINGHNFHGTVGYQHELTKIHSLGASTDYLITDNIVSINSSLDDDQLVSEAISELTTQSAFGRFRYNYKEKYLFEMIYRLDGSSKFAPGEQTASYPSFSAGYNIAKEDFWPIDEISTLKLRASHGTLGNQRGGANTWYTDIDFSNTNFLFNGAQAVNSLTPGLDSRSLTWEESTTTDVGFDVAAFQNKLNVGFSWYRTDTKGLIGESQSLPAQLGTGAPITNATGVRVQGWELEASWRHKIGNVGYNIRGVISDYKRTVIDFDNENDSFAEPYYEGQDLGEIWGLTWDGWFNTDEEAANHTINQSFVTGWAYSAGDTKYKDINEDGVINRGNWSKGDTGDFKVIGNSTPRYQFSFTLGMDYKGFDFNAFLQGVGKRDVLISNHQRFRGPAQGPFHINVWEEHLDYFRPEDTTNPLGPNLDAYFPAPYTANPGRNNKNYAHNVDRYIQNGAYVRLKSLQLGYTLPKKFTQKLKINKFRLFVTGENLFTLEDMLFFDPEIVTSGVAGSAQSYPLSKIISTGVNISF